MARHAKYRDYLPQLDGDLFLSMADSETTLIFREGWELPCFEAFVLLTTGWAAGAPRLFDRYIPMAIEAGAGFILESPTWRANPDWGKSSATVQRRSRASTAPPSR